MNAIRARVALTLAFLLAAAAAAPAQVPSREALIVFGDSSFPPYESLVDGKPAGANVDLWNAIGAILGRRIDMRLGPWDDAQRQVLAGAGDALSFVAVTDERRQNYDFTGPTFTFRYPVFARANDVARVNPKNLAGKRIAVKRGGFPAAVLTQLSPNALPVLIDSVVEGFRMVLRGEVDGLIETEWVGYDLLRANRFSGISATPEALAVRTAHIAVRKGDQALVNELNRAIARLSESDELDRIADKWAGADFVLWDRREFQRTLLITAASVFAVLSLLGGLYGWRLWRVNVSLREEIVKRETAQNQLYQAQKMEAMGQLAGGIAHDFNNLIGAVLGFARFIAEDTEPKSRVHGYAQRILSASQRARDLIQQILAFSRRENATRQPMAIARLVEESAELLRATVPATLAIEVRNDFPEAWSIVNPTQITQILVNLCLNAADAMGGKTGTLTLVAARLSESDMRFKALVADEGDGLPQMELASTPDGVSRCYSGSLRKGRAYLVLCVRDHGSGMTPDVLLKIFDPFFTTKPQGQGTGLGLPMVQRLVGAHEGAMVITTRPGMGTSFDIILPVSDRTAPETAESVIRAPGTEPPRELAAIKGRVLVVDDDLHFGDMISTALDRAGYEVGVCGRPSEAIEVFAEQPLLWDVVVSDQTMPEMSGLEMIGRLKALNPGLRCILCTGYASSSLNTASARAGGADAFFHKPVDVDRILALIGGFTAGKATPSAR